MENKMKFHVIYTDHSSDSAVSAEYLQGMKRSEIASVYIIDAGRPASEREIKQILDGTWMGL
jgi:hypothetical protein